MFTHPYHYQLMRDLVRIKVKGDHRIPLTCADRLSLVANKNVHISKAYIMKVLSEGDCAPCHLSQSVLDELMRFAGHTDWNSFLRKNPVPEGQHYPLMGKKGKKKLHLAVEARIAELKLMAHKDDKE
ncbi:MAG: hypothetical protein K9J06_03435 [Flavobacteriales bacterium]|nr:hypothetical protein [Flavobacteriales bacterium]